MLEDLLRERGQEWTQQLADTFADQVRANAPRATGELAESVEVGGVVGGDVVTCSVTVTSAHAQYQEEGTGIYGPTGQRIEGNPLLAFDWPAAGGMVIVHSVAGTEPTHFFQRAVDEWPSMVASI